MNELKARTAYSITNEEKSLEMEGATLVYLKSDVDKYVEKLQSEIAEKDQRIKELTPTWVRLSDRLPTTAGPHLVIFQNGRGGCLPFNVEAKSFQVAGTVQWWADAKYIFGDWEVEK